jgi:hypothetical protein
MPPSTRPISRRWRKACRCLLRRETKARQAAMRDSAPRPMASASAPCLYALQRRRWGNRFRRYVSGHEQHVLEFDQQLNLRFGPLVHSGDPLERLVRGFDPGGLFGYSVGYGPAAFVEAAWRNNTKTSEVAGGQRRDPAGAQPAFRRKIWWWEAVARDTPNLRGKRACRGSRTMASGIFPTYRSSPPTESGATTTCTAFPILSNGGAPCTGAPD